MYKIILLAILFAGCTSQTENSSPQDLDKEDQNKATDTRTVNPQDTSARLDTGSYDKLSDSLRKQ